MNSSSSILRPSGAKPLNLQMFSTRLPFAEGAQGKKPWLPKSHCCKSRWGLLNCPR